MNVLFINTGNILFEELQELSDDIPVTPYVASSHAKAIGILANHSIDMVIFALRTMSDLEFLKHINTSYQQIEVILTVEESVHEIIDILKNGKYRVLHTPFKLSELKRCVEQEARLTS
jgi:DNA-binding NtrC family response regulator